MLLVGVGVSLTGGRTALLFHDNPLFWSLPWWLALSTAALLQSFDGAPSEPNVGPPTLLFTAGGLGVLLVVGFRCFTFVAPVFGDLPAVLASMLAGYALIQILTLVFAEAAYRRAAQSELPFSSTTTRRLGVVLVGVVLVHASAMAFLPDVVLRHRSGSGSAAETHPDNPAARRLNAQLVPFSECAGQYGLAVSDAYSAPTTQEELQLRLTQLRAKCGDDVISAARNAVKRTRFHDPRFERAYSESVDGAADLMQSYDMILASLSKGRQVSNDLIALVERQEKRVMEAAESTKAATEEIYGKVNDTPGTPLLLMIKAATSLDTDHSDGTRDIVAARRYATEAGESLRRIDAKNGDGWLDRDNPAAVRAYGPYLAALKSLQAELLNALDAEERMTGSSDLPQVFTHVRAAQASFKVLMRDALGPAMERVANE